MSHFQCSFFRENCLAVVLFFCKFLSDCHHRGKRERRACFFNPVDSLASVVKPIAAVPRPQTIDVLETVCGPGPQPAAPYRQMFTKGWRQWHYAAMTLNLLWVVGARSCFVCCGGFEVAAAQRFLVLDTYLIT